MPCIATRVASADPPVRARPAVAPLAYFKSLSEFPAGARLIAIRKGGTISVTPDGLLHIVEPACGGCGPGLSCNPRGHDGKKPDVLWFVGGVTTAAGRPTTPESTPSDPGPFVYTWVTQASQINLQGTNTLVRFSVKESPSDGVVAVAGVNECWF